MEDLWEDNSSPRGISKKKIFTIIIIAIIVILFIVLTVMYFVNSPVREWVDKKIFRKEIMQDNVTTIELKEGQNANIYAFNKYIGVLNKNQFLIYSNTGTQEKNLEVQVSNPIFDSANRFLAMAEKNGKKLYLISDKEIAWEASIEGSISQIHVNKNGYVAVVITNTSYKTVIAMFDTEGKEMFKTYLSTTRTADVSISNNNKYLAIAEVDTSGTIIQSNIKIISIEKASTDPTNSLENTYKGEPDNLITNIQYQDKDTLVCMYTDSIHIIENGKDEVLIQNDNKKMIFQSIELTNNVVKVEEKSSGLFTADSIINLVNTESKANKQYTVNAVAKEIYTYGNVVALNLGTEIEFVNTDGWLIKRYIANQEITNIVVSDSIAGIIYRDRIEVVNL